MERFSFKSARVVQVVKHLNKAEDIATGKLVALKSHRLTIDTAGATKSHWLVTDTAGATINHRIVIDTAYCSSYQFL